MVYGVVPSAKPSRGRWQLLLVVIVCLVWMHVKSSFQRPVAFEGQREFSTNCWNIVYLARMHSRTGQGDAISTVPRCLLGRG